MRVFFSYASEDRAFLDEVLKRLKRLRSQKIVHDVWYDESTLLVGDRWSAEIKKRIGEADIIVLLVSPDAAESGPCEEEREWAMEREREGRARLVPLVVRAGSFTPEDLLTGMGLQGLHAAVKRDGRLEPVENWPRPDLAYRRFMQQIRSVALQRPEPKAPTTVYGVRSGKHPEQVIGRDYFVEAVRNMLLDAGRPLVLTGRGGVGKSTVAFEYAQRHAEHYEVVLWLRAEKPEQLVWDRHTVAARLDLPVTDVEVVGRAFRHWLDTTDVRYLMICDNANDPESVAGILPERARGHIILTSRSSAWGESAAQLPLGGLKPEHALRMLTDQSGVADDGSAAGLAEELEFNPEALATAAATIASQGRSFGAYLRELRGRRDR